MKKPFHSQYFFHLRVNFFPAGQNGVTHIPTGRCEVHSPGETYWWHPPMSPTPTVASRWTGVWNAKIGIPGDLENTKFLPRWFLGFGVFLECEAWLGFGERWVSPSICGLGCDEGWKIRGFKWWWGFQPQLFFWDVSLTGTWHISKAWMVPGTLKLTASFLHPKMDGWKTESFIFVGWPIYKGQTCC